MGKHSKKRSSIITKILLIPIIVILLVCIITAAYVAVTMDDWASFDPKKVENMEQTSFIYDYKDDVITGIHGPQNRVNVSLKNVPKHVQNAFIAVEDVRFYQHHGIDIKRIFGALIQDIKARAPVQGGSTITQQLVKLSHLSNKKNLR
jgi:penicillin-binding protein 1A